MSKPHQFQRIWDADALSQITTDVDWNHSEALTHIFREEHRKTTHATLVSTDDDFYEEVTYYLYAIDNPNHFMTPDRIATGPRLIRQRLCRTKLQNLVFTAFIHLVEPGLMTLSGLETPMIMRGGQWSEKDDVYVALDSFELIGSICNNKIFPFEDHNEDFNGYSTPLHWLSTAIVRSTTTKNFREIVRRLDELGQFGRLDMELLDKWWPLTRELKQNLIAGYMPLPEEGRLLHFCCWLPHDIEQGRDVEYVCREFGSKFQHVEATASRFLKLPLDHSTTNHSPLLPESMEETVTAQAV